MKMELKFSEFKLVLSQVIQNYGIFQIDYRLLVKHIVQCNVLTDEIANISTLSSKLDLIESKLEKDMEDRHYLDLFKRDLGKLKKIIKRNDQSLNIEHILGEGTVILDILNSEFGGNITELPKIFSVDQFPKPYESVTTWDFMYADEEDHQKYGIERGLYVHRNRQFPKYSEYLVLHELVHHYVDMLKAEDETRHRWLEESIANWFAFVLHYTLFKDREFILFVKRVNDLYKSVFPYSVIAEYSFYDYAFSTIYSLGGHHAIRALCRNYVATPASAEWQELLLNILDKNFDDLKGHARNWKMEGELDMLLQFQILQDDILNLTSLEYIILHNLQTRVININEVSNEVGVDKEEIGRGISQLQNKGLVVLDGNTFKVMTNVWLMIRSGKFRVKYLWKSGYSN